MKNLINKSGFTLIEIIVVLIIVGILAAIALPNLFSNVNKSRAEEALGTIGTFRPTIEACIMKDGGQSESVDCTSANIGNPVSSANFGYALTGPSGAKDTSYSILATGTNALQSTDTITVSRGKATYPSVGTVTCSAANALQGAC